ncbi:MAG: hypothetical protein ACOX87_14105 [Chloroflexota bacterium]
MHNQIAISDLYSVILAYHSAIHDLYSAIPTKAGIQSGGRTDVAWPPLSRG